jgi:hypothetical protein
MQKPFDTGVLFVGAAHRQSLIDNRVRDLETA